MGVIGASKHQREKYCRRIINIILQKTQKNLHEGGFFDKRKIMRLLVL